MQKETSLLESLTLQEKQCILDVFKTGDYARTISRSEQIINRMPKPSYVQREIFQFVLMPTGASSLPVGTNKV